MKFSLFSLLFLIGSSCFSQNYLICRKGTKSHRIMEGSSVAYSLGRDTALIHGELTAVLDSSIVINNVDTVLVSQLSVLRVYRENFGVRLVKGLGRQLPMAGVYYLVFGTLNSIIFDYPPLFSLRRTLIAASISATGFAMQGLGKILDHKTYRSTNWYFIAMSFDNLNQ